jgi:hypothetical protein
MAVTLDAQIAEVAREIALRRNVYPYQVAKGKMTQMEATQHILNMEAVVETLNWLKRHEQTVRDAVAKVPA